MREIEKSSAFKKDFKRIHANPRHRKDIDHLLLTAIDLLLIDSDLPKRFRDHGLIGNLYGHRECHIKPDVLLIYKKPNPRILRLARLGSHSDLFI